jgi:shikimate kinase
VFLVGFMGSGKTSVGHDLATRLGCEFVDLDQQIEARTGRSVGVIFRDLGEGEFRRVEHAELKELLRESGSMRIVALGGGAFAQPRNADAIRDEGAITIFLDAPPDVLWQRCQEDPQERPLRGQYEQFAELHGQRMKHYLAASWRVDSSHKSVKEIAAHLEQRINAEFSAQEKTR